MVFFCCDGCGETLKKARVDAHAAKCRECYSVSCVDCSQTFFGDDYRLHTSCISEAERYEKTIFRGTRKLDGSGTGHRQQQQHKGKMSPQEAWNQTIQAASDKAPPSLSSYMAQLAMLENVPRKEKQFRNFTSNSLRLKGPSGEKTKTEIWALLVKVREEEKTIREEQDKKKQQMKTTSLKKDEKSEKETNSMPVSDSDDEPHSMTEMPSEKAVTKAIKKALKKSSNKQLKFKALRKQVQESLSFKASKDGKKKWKCLLRQCVDANPKKLVMNGKTVALTK